MSLFKSFAPLQFGKRQMLGTVLLIVGTLLLVSTLFVANVGDNKAVLDGILSWYRVVVWGLPAAMITAGLAFRSTPIRSSLGRLAVDWATPPTPSI